MSEFPIMEISKLAERESWRKEINRPIYHLHKWWAQRLGSVFRAILIYLLKPPENETWELFYKENNFDKVIFDPFMGSGTTLGEALKVGARVIGCDINPISSFLVRQELTHVILDKVEQQMNNLEEIIAPKIRKYYITYDPITESEIPVLYYFWVKLVVSPSGEKIPLFSSYVFARNAYPSKKPNAQILCPRCWGIFTDRYDSTNSTCPHCSKLFNPQDGPAKGTNVRDSKGEKHKIKSLLNNGKRLEEKMYALLAINSAGKKEYLRPTDFDMALYQEAVSRLPSEDLPLPEMLVRAGHNTDQARGYNYLAWRDFFNPRQLLCLGLLLKEIMKIDNIAIREQFLCLFSGTLEFNNTFCSYKGEGTGAVRPIFSNHILKPERTPLENSVWGTEKSSGCFSTLYKTRLLPAKKYLENPFEIAIDDNGKSSKITSSKALMPCLVSDWNALSNTERSALIFCGDSANLSLPDSSVDMIVTDPPYFDYIHYSELSDFFYAWLSPVLEGDYHEFRGGTSGRPNEVQQKCPDKFAKMLCRVFKECYRVMKDEAKLCFSFHHTQPEGWAAIAEALIDAEFYVDEAFPVHAELMASTPKAGAKEPISLDTMLVCSKIRPSSVKDHQATVLGYLNLFAQASKKLSQADIFVIHAAQNLVRCVNKRLPKAEILQVLRSGFTNAP
jgi:putative DNA methylase